MRKLHDPEFGGDGCWQEEICRSRRSYYRKGRSRLVQRKTAIAPLCTDGDPPHTSTPELSRQEGWNAWGRT